MGDNILFNNNRGTWLAQAVEPTAGGLGMVSLSPKLDVEITLKLQ